MAVEKGQFNAISSPAVDLSPPFPASAENVVTTARKIIHGWPPTLTFDKPALTCLACSLTRAPWPSRGHSVILSRMEENLKHFYFSSSHNVPFFLCKILLSIFYIIPLWFFSLFQSYCSLFLYNNQDSELTLNLSSHFLFCHTITKEKKNFVNANSEQND